MDFASQNLTAGQLNAIVKKLGGEEAAKRFLRDELVAGHQLDLGLVHHRLADLVVLRVHLDRGGLGMGRRGGREGGGSKKANQELFHGESVKAEA